MLTLPEILASLPDAAKEVVPKPVAQVAVDPAPVDPVNDAATDDASQVAVTPDIPRAAQIAYIAGRIALTEGKMQAAILQLKIALSIAPNEADIARLLATAYLRIGNRPAAAMYLQQTLRSEPDDIDSLIKLGRASLERGEWAPATVLFARSLELAKASNTPSPALVHICEFYLGSALEVGGHDKASAEQYLASMEDDSRLTDQSAATYQMMMLSRQFGVVWQAIGDARLRMGQPVEALAAYEQAVAVGVPSLPDWMARYVYTQLLLGRPSNATARMVEYLKSSVNDSNALPLVKYLIDHGGDGRSLAQILQQVYTDSDKSSALAQMISSLLPDDQAQAFLLAHLKNRPADTLVAGTLIRRSLAAPSGQAAGKATDAALSRAANALRVTSSLIEQSPVEATVYAQAYLDALGNKPGLDAVIAWMESSKQADAITNHIAVRFIIAADHFQSGQLRRARPILEGITRDDPTFLPARILLAGQLVARSNWDEASNLLKDINTEPWNSQADNLRVRIFAGQGKTSDAIALLDELIAREPAGGVDLSLYKATLQVQSGQAVQGERTLLDLLNVHPRDERIYKVLFDIYDRGDVPDVSTQYQRLMIRLFETIPQSRIAKLQQVEMLIVRRENNQAEALLRELITRSEKDFEALGILARLLQENARGGEADQLVAERLAKFGDDASMLRFAAEYYQAFKNLDKSYEVRERLAKLLDDPSQQAMSLAVLYMQQNKLEMAQTQAELALSSEPEDAQTVVSVLLHVISRIADATPVEQRKAVVDNALSQVVAAIKLFPALEADIRYELSSFHARLGDEQASQDVLAAVVEKFPKHAPSNNGLGYSWADKGIHLQKARDMIQVAVDAEPHNAAYLDSLGWVYYKLGQFDEAVQWLSQAATGKGAPSPVILDHLGDALYRSGDQAKAIQIWRQAQRLLEVSDFSADPEAARLPDVLRSKVEAASRKQDVPLSPVPPVAATP